jgi:hypothetical protein
MRSFICAVVLITLAAAPSAAQLLQDARDNARKPAGQPAGDVKAGADRQAAGGRGTAPQSNAMFVAIDVDADGVITKAELRKAIKQLMTLDTDKDGNITLAEASPGGLPANNAIAGRAGVVGQGAGGQPNDVGGLVVRYDVDNDGKLSVAEIPPGMARMFRPTDDINGNGLIDPAELQGVLTRSGIDPRAWAANPDNAAQRTPFRDPNRRRPPRDDNKNKN